MKTELRIERTESLEGAADCGVQPGLRLTFRSPEGVLTVFDIPAFVCHEVATLASDPQARPFILTHHAGE